MFRRIIAFMMTGQLLFGSIALPLGDFSLLKQLPAIYQAYEKVAAPDERGVLDFVGDYLLNGKELLGHNQRDQTSNSADLQFQHAVAFAAIVHPELPLVGPALMPARPVCYTIYLPVALSDYHPSLFRPPLAQA